MTTVTIISGFLGAGKTTLIRRLLQDVFVGEKIVLIENEFGEIGIDGGFLRNAGVEISEMNSGCICCSLVGDFGSALEQVMEQFHPDRILIEPSGVGKLSDVIRAVAAVAEKREDMRMGSHITVADAVRCKTYAKNFGEFYRNQVAFAGAILLSRTANREKAADAAALLRTMNPTAPIVTTDWDELSGEQLRDLADGHTADLLAETCPVCGHEHHHHDEHCDCGHEHHHHDEHCDCGHEHHHHDEHCDCGHEHHHHADEVFTSWGAETARAYTEEQLEEILSVLDSGRLGTVLRCKGIVPNEKGGWLHFDYVPEERSIRSGSAEYTGRICAIGSGLKETELAALFGV